MGPGSYTHVVPWQPDVAKALSTLRGELLERGDVAASGEGFATPEGALASSLGARGSILEITKVSEERSLFAASGFDDEELDYYFGTTEPTLREVQKNEAMWTDIERGSARYVVAYQDGRPAHIVFLGCAFE